MPHPLRSVAVFCGSRFGTDPAHTEAARALGTGLARQGLKLVYGGGGVGLMGEIASAALAAGGEVHGIIPDFLLRAERPPPSGMTALEVVPSMHARKTRMFELSDGFIALSGGLGTLDELVEILTWRQLGLHDKPVVALDIAGWAQPFVALVEAMIGQGFVAESGRRLFQVAPTVPECLALLHAAPVPNSAAPAGKL
jgi:uncharacterized protein (TIGR00730 family)